MLTKEISAGAVTSIAATDLVLACGNNGGLKPISAQNLDISLRKASGKRADTSIGLTKGKWIRVAKCQVQFFGILAILGSYQGNEIPIPAFIAVGGYCASWSNTKAYWINNDVSCVSAVRFVKEGSDYYVEIKYNKDQSNNIYVRLSNEYNISLVSGATVSTAESSDVLKTVEFSVAGGGVNQYRSIIYAILQKGGLRDVDERAYQRHNQGETDGGSCVPWRGYGRERLRDNRILECAIIHGQHSVGNIQKHPCLLPVSWWHAKLQNPHSDTDFAFQTESKDLSQNDGGRGVVQLGAAALRLGKEVAA